MKHSFRQVAAVGVVVMLASCAGPRAPSSGSSAGQCVVKSTDLTSDLSFTIQCPMKGEEWGWCSNGCPADLDIAYDAQAGGRAEQGSMVAHGKCDAPVGNTVICRFPDASTGEAFGKDKARLDGSQSFQWTDFEGKRRVGIEMQDPVHGRRRTAKVLFDPATADRTVVAVDRTIASWNERHVVEAEKEREWRETHPEEARLGECNRQCITSTRTECSLGSMLTDAQYAQQKKQCCQNLCARTSQLGPGTAQPAGQQPGARRQPPPQARTSGPVEPVKHCVQNPDNNCSNKKFFCDVRRENLEHPDSDTSDGHGNRICCWLHHHP